VVLGHCRSFPRFRQMHASTSRVKR
jgi:hypothetical protein